MGATGSGEMEKMDIETLREKLDIHLDSTRRKVGTKQRYHRALNKVHQIIPSLEFSRSNVKKFIAILTREGYKPSVVRFHYFFLRSLVENVLERDWPLKRVDIPPEPGPGELSQPILEEMRIKEMILRAKKARLRPADLTRFVASTVYGARRIELAKLDENSFNLELKVVRIETRKRGEPRTHVVPDEIIPWLRPKGLEPIDEGEMSATFIRIEETLGFEHQKGFGWHAIRRRMATWFEDHDVSEKNVDIFMRWKRRKTTRSRYVVRTPTETEKVQAEVDRKMFQLHPFLSSWTSTEP